VAGDCTRENKPKPVVIGVSMSDAAQMRFQLQQVAAYRELCRGVRRSGRENVFFAGLMLLFAYFAWQQNMGVWKLFGIQVERWIIFTVLVGFELMVGLYKWLLPSAEGCLLDGFVLLFFTAYNVGVMLQFGRQPNAVMILVSTFVLFGAFNRFKAYGQLRRLFTERPSAEHMAWFDELVDEIRIADPRSDELVLDLPTGPHWKAKLLGSTVFFIALRGTAVWISSPEDFEILREKSDHGTGRRKAILRIFNQPYPEFDIDDATWENYKKWRIENPNSP
jgi:hypothetical protein